MNDTSNITTTIHIQGDISNFDKTLSQIEKQLNQLKLPQSLTVGLDDRLVKLKQNLQKLAELTANNLVNPKDMTQVNKLIESIDKQFADLSRKLESEGIASAALKKDARVLESLKKAQDEYTNSIAATQKEQAKLNEALEKAKKAQAAAEEKRSKKIVSDIDYTRTQEIYKEKKKSSKEASANLSTAREAMETKMATSGGKYTTTSDPNFHRTKEYRAYAEALKIATKAEQELAAARAEAEKYTTENLNVQEAQQYTEKVQQAQQALDNFNNSQLKANEQNAFNNLKKSIQSLPSIDWQEYGIDVSTINSVEDLEDALKKVGNVAANNTVNGMQVIRQESTNLKSSLDNVKQSAKESGEELEKAVNKSETTQGIVNRIKQFVGWTGAAVAFRKVAQDAISTIKELDKQMTEMAVVTDMRVPDYWNQLPQYTQRANELGVSIKAVYEAATLYYQQGLKTNEVVALSNATLKMARIAGLDAADATDKMTAALRGFNMELSDTSATNVADVYSKLAAITAADVEEISTAMTKTASIASSANMEFETTAAFLSQIIETTRESAETAGTALKTVIARFQELKKDPSEIGEVDGEIIDANKIETALRSVGVALRDQQGQFRDLDDVFLELSSKWQTLDTNTQRYIATIAAGSRQQSRFIAMMQDYGRTTELVNAANNAAGASNEQFSKTLDSLESKVERLKNSWHTFTLGLMNNELIKGAIDLLNGFITVINKVTQGWDSFSGGALKLGLVVSALYAGDKALKVFTSSLKGGATIFQSFGAVGKATIDNLKLKIQQLKGLFNKTDATNGLNVTVQKLNTQLNQGSSVLNKYNQNLKAQNVMAKQKANLDAQLINGAITQTQYEERLNQQTVIQNTLKKEQVSLEAAYATQLGIDQTVMSNYLGIKASGLMLNNQEIGDKVALVLASQGYTAQQLAEMNAKKRNNILTAATIIANKSEAKTKLGSAIASGLTSIAMKLEARSKNGSTVATWLLTAANWALNASLGAIVLVILAVIAALALLVVGILLIVKAIKKAKENSPEGQLKKAQEALENMTKAADAAAESYNNLNDSLTELDDKYKTLDELTVGTQEWRDAIAEVNSKVMDLINTYPELASAVENVNGVLEINKQKQEEILRQKFQEKQIAANIKLAQQQEVVQKQQEVNFENLSGKAKIGNNKTQGEKYKAETKQVAIALASGEIAGIEGDDMKEKIEKYLTDTLKLDSGDVSKWAEELDESATELKTFGDGLISANEQVKVFSESMAANAASMLDFSTSTEQSVVSNLITGDLFDMYQSEFESQLEQIKDKNLKDDEDFKQFVKETYGIGAEITDEGKIKYSEGTIGAKDAREAYAQYKATKELGGATGESLKKFYASITDSAQISALLDRSGKKIKKGDVDKLAGTSIDTTGLSDEVAAEVQRVYKESIQTASNALIQATSDLDKVMSKKISFSDKLTTEAIAGLAEHFKQAAFISGDESVVALNNEITKIIGSLSETQADVFLTTLNSIDWTDKSGILNFTTQLEEAGLDVSTDMYKLQDSIIKATNATYKLNFKGLQEKVNSLGSIYDKIRSGEQGREFSDEDYQTMINNLPEMTKQFIKSLDGNYVYIGNSMDALTDALNNNTTALLGERSEQIRATAFLNKFIDKREFGDLSNKSTNELINIINEFISGSQISGVNLNTLNIKNFSTEMSKLTALSNEELIQLINDFITTGKEYSKSDLEQFVNLMTTDYLKQNETENVQTLKLLLQDYQNERDELIKGQIEGIVKSMSAQAALSGISDSQIAEFQTNIQTLLTNIENAPTGRNIYGGVITGTEVSDILTDATGNFSKFLSEYINKPWEETFGQIAQLSDITDYYNNQLSALQSEYDELTESQENNGESLYNNLSKQQEIYKSLNKVIESNILENKEAIKNYLAQYEYLKVISNPVTGQSMATIDFSKVGTTDEKIVAAQFEEFKKLVEESNSLNNAQKTTLQSINKNEQKAKQYYTDSISTVRDALISQKESQIDELSNINDTITNVADSIVSGMRDAISEDRQQRENEEQLQSIQDKEARLAYLQATGGSQVEILALQKEIADDQQSYQESLVDQQLDAMEKANEQAASQREKQIEIAQAQFEYWKGADSWTDAKRAVDNAINDPSGESQQNLQKLIAETTDRTLSKTEKEKIVNAFGTDLSFAKSFKENGMQLSAKDNEDFSDLLAGKLSESVIENLKSYIGPITGIEAGSGNNNGGLGNELELYNELTSKINSAKSFKDLFNIQRDINKKTQNKELSGNTANLLTKSVDSAYQKKISDIDTLEKSNLATEEVNKDFIVNRQTGRNEDRSKILGDIAERQKELLKTSSDEGQLTQGHLIEIKTNSGKEKAYIPSGGWTKSTEFLPNQQKRIDQANPGQLFLYDDKLWIRGKNKDIKTLTVTSDNLDFVDDYKEKLKSTYYDLEWGNSFIKFKTGGLANFTGPAWLDGTPSAPELVLNSTDTKNFIQLRDILSEILKPGTTQNTTNNEGDTYIDIDINVDELANDYDVDEVAERVQEIIVRDANYRNVNNVYLNK